MNPIAVDLQRESAFPYFAIAFASLGFEVVVVMAQETCCSDYIL